jgi:hypothetical protein
LSEAGRTSDAITVLQDVVAGLGRDGKLAVDVRIALGEFYLQDGRGTEADVIFRQALPDARRVYGPFHPKTRLIRDRLRHFRGPRMIRVSRITFIAAILAAGALAVGILTAVSVALRP